MSDLPNVIDLIAGYMVSPAAVEILAERAEAAEAQTQLDAAATAADRVQTGLDRTQTGADRTQTGLDRTATAADRVQTGLDAVATAADRVQTGLDRTATSADAAAADADATATAADRVQTGLDAASTSADAAATALDAIATAADRVQTGLDRTAAASSASSASSSASAAAASLDSFDDRYLGAKAANPAVDNDGAALITGALYWNTASQVMRTWNGTIWVDIAPTTGAYLPLAGGNLTGDVALRDQAGISHAASVFPDIRPTLNLDLTSEVMDHRITYTGGTNGTRVNKLGLLVSTGGLWLPDYDPVTKKSLGRPTWEARTNLLLRSQEFDNASWNSATSAVTIAADVATAPDGTNTADKFTPTAVSSAHKVYRQITPTAASTAYAYSVFVKANGYNYAVLSALYSFSSTGVSFLFDLNAKTATVLSSAGWTASGYARDAGNGWVQCVMVFTNPASNPADYFVIAASPTAAPSVDAASRTPTYTGDGTSGLYIWGAQLEAGAFPTSYIPTTSATVTRAADVASITGTNFSDWFNASEGTFVVEYDMLTTGPFGIVTASDGTSNNYIMLDTTSGGNPRYRVGVSAVSQASIVSGSSVSANTTTKTAVAYAANDFILAMNGTLATPDTSGSLPVVDSLRIAATTGGTALNGHIRRLTYYPARLSNAHLQALTGF